VAQEGDTMNRPNVRRDLPPRVDCCARGPVMTELELTSAVRSDACVLLTGKKDAVRAVARRIHILSGWRQGPLTIVDCGWPEKMVERVLSEAFAETGSAAGEPHMRPAQAGAVLLQDVRRLSPSFQSRLAERLVQWRGKRQTGSSRCRLMASTSEPLLPRVLDGTFDDRLYYRLNVIHLVVSSDRTAEDARGIPDVRDKYLNSPVATHDSEFPT
jgi:DNA-binding NtrC family response regulator